MMGHLQKTALVVAARIHRKIYKENKEGYFSSLLVNNRYESIPALEAMLQFHDNKNTNIASHL